MTETVTDDKKADNDTEEGDGDDMKDGDQVKAAAPATIVVSLPAEAKLTIDGVATKATSARRVFVSPTLAAGKVFTYTLKAEIVQDGETLTINKTIEIRAGQETAVELNAADAVASR